MKNTTKLVTLAMFAAISILLVYLIRFPIFPAIGFMEYDPADVPIFIATFLFGPWAGLMLTAVVAVLQGITVSAQSGPIGILMHFLATGTFVLVTGLLTRNSKGIKRTAFASAIGVIAWIVIMFFWNLLLTPIFMGVPRDAVIGLMPLILAFNAIKAGVNSLLAVGLHNRLSKLKLFR